MDDEIKEFLDYLEFEKKFSLYTVDNYDKDITETFDADVCYVSSLDK